MISRQRHTRRVSAAFVAWCALLLTGSTLTAAEREFRPEACFPNDCQLWISVDIARGNGALAQWPLGALASDPGVRRALGAVPSMLEGQIAGVLREADGLLGTSAAELLGLLAGDVTIAVRMPPSLAAEPELYVAIGVGEHGEKFRPVINRLASMLAQQGSVTQDADRRGNWATIVETRGPVGTETALHLGEHIVIVRGGGVDALLDRFEGKTKDGFATNEAFARIAKSGLKDPIATALVDLGGAWRTLDKIEAEVPDDQPIAQWFAQMRQIATESGLAAVTSLSYQLAFTDGDFEHAIRVDSPGGLQGYFADIAANIGPPEDRDGLAKVPRSAEDVASFSIHKGHLLSQLLERTARLPIPNVDRFVAAFRGGVKEATGLSVETDLGTLPRLTLTTFRVPPPAGGLVADRFAIARAEQIAPYLVALDRFVNHVGSELEAIEIGERPVVTVRMPSLLRSLGVGPATGPLAALSDEAKVGLLALDPGVSIAITPLDDEWIVMADSPQAIERYLLVHQGAPKIDAATRSLPEGVAFASLGGGRAALVAYNTLVTLATLAAPTFDRLRLEMGVDPALLPPGEAFLSRFQRGILTLDTRGDALTIRGHRVLTNALPALLPRFVEAAARAGSLKFRM